MTFEQCLMECAGTPGLIAEFDRLTGSNLSMRGAPINVMVDDATGKTDEDLRKFVAFVLEFVWLPLALKGGDE